MKFRETVCFDDVLLEPQKSTINSREEIDLITTLGKLNFNFPVISSPMDTVTESSMAIAMARFGGLGIIHRYNTVQHQCELVSEIYTRLEESASSAASNIAAAIGTSDDFSSRAESLFSVGARILCIDVAHGHHALVERSIKSLKDKYADSITIIAGNIATPQAFSDLSDWGADAVRVGIGGGSICSTRIQTGHGIPTLQSVLDCRDIADTTIIADGGIKTSGDIVKALAAGADMVMLGSMLAGTSDTPGEVFQSTDNKRYKVYRGMASPEAQIAWRGEARSLEGVSTTVDFKGNTRKILSKTNKNIKSGLSYTGARNLKELRSRARFIKQTPAGLVESNTHILAR